MKFNINQSVIETQRRRQGKVVVADDHHGQVRVLFDDGEYEWLPPFDLEIIND
jgi:hypothetical protein